MLDSVIKNPGLGKILTKKILAAEEEIVKSSIFDCMINRIEVENGGKVGVLFNVIRTSVLEQIEKTTDDSSISPILGSLGSFKLTVMAHFV